MEWKVCAFSCTPKNRQINNLAIFILECKEASNKGISLELLREATLLRPGRDLSSPRISTEEPTKLNDLNERQTDTRECPPAK